ncbi:MAG: hypothetical protein PUP91_15790 [Rhizonema sp. PD37]|nr:hypothetical protein [Rhizonema sp. PD37]
MDGAYYSFVGFAGNDTKEGPVTEVIAANAAAVGVPYAYFNGDREPSSYHYMQKPTIKITLCTQQTPMLRSSRGKHRS